MSNMIFLSDVNLVEGEELTVLRDCLKSSERMLLAVWYMVAPVNGSHLNNTSRAQGISVHSANKSLLPRVWSEWFGFQRVTWQLTTCMGLSAERASGTYSLCILSELFRFQVRAKNNAASQVLLFAISLTKHFLHSVLAGKGER